MAQGSRLIFAQEKFLIGNSAGSRNGASNQRSLGARLLIRVYTVLGNKNWAVDMLKLLVWKMIQMVTLL